MGPLRRVQLGGARSLFSLQLALLEVTLRGPLFYRDHPRALGFLLASGALLYLGSCARGRLARGALALTLGLAIAVQIAFYRYYHATLDAQAAESARLAWGDVWPVVARALPGTTLGGLLVASIEYAWLARLPALTTPRWPAAALAIVLGVFAGGAARDGTTEVRTAAALASLARPRPVIARSDHRTLPPIGSRRDRVPSVLFVLTESVRAADACGAATEPCASSPELAALLPDRIAFREMRSVASYTAISLSALLTGLPQVGPREAVASAPDLFDIARATRDGSARVGVHYWSSHASSFFERAHPESAVDSYLTGEMMLGRPVEDVERDVVMGGLDRTLARACAERIPGLAPPYVAMVHFSGTHVPYFFDDAEAKYTPFGRVVTWSGLDDLHRAYQNSLLEQDRSISVCVRAFLEANRGRPHVVVYTSDHGESFGDHGAIHHGQHLYDEQLHVPAFVAAFDGALDANERTALEGAAAAFVTHLDVLPTLLDVLGVLDHPSLARDVARMAGRSLLRASNAPAPILPITNCTEMWTCPLNVWGVLAGDRKLVAQAWDAQWKCMALAGGERQVERERCGDLIEASRGVFAEMPNGGANR